MREVKFRVWDKELNRMCDVIQLGTKDIIVNYIEEDDISGYLPIDRFEVLQYTGLKDKNEKEIYEGDIIEYIEDGTCEVVYQHDSGAWMAGNNVIWEEIDESGFNPYKVIGSVYENFEPLSYCKYFNDNICMFDNTKCYLKNLHDEGLFFDCNKFI